MFSDGFSEPGSQYRAFHPSIMRGDISSECVRYHSMFLGQGAGDWSDGSTAGLVDCNAAISISERE